MLSDVRTVVTGADVLCPLGNSPAEASESISVGRSGVGPITAFDPSTVPVRIAAEVKNWSPPAGASRILAMLTRAGQRAIAQAGLNPTETRIGLSIGLGRLPLRLSTDLSFDVEEEVHRDPDTTAIRLAGTLGLEGPILACYTACASGTDAIGLGRQMLRRGDVDVVLCGAADVQVAPMAIFEFSLLGALAKPAGDEDLEQPKPFDRRRNGFVIGEGAAMLVIETLGHARRRSSKVLGEVSGYGSATDPQSLTRGDFAASGPVAAMRAALMDAHLVPEQIDYVNAHGTGTAINDRLEALALRTVFGDFRVPVSSTKGVTGHLLAAAGALEAWLCLDALAQGRIPETKNLSEPEWADCLDHVSGEPRVAQLKTAMSNSFGFGGQNSVLVVTNGGEHEV